MQHTCNWENIFIGSDIETVSRFDKYSADVLLAKKLGIFTDKELEYCFKQKKVSESLAVRFCAKEAVYKALSQANFPDIPKFCDMEILNHKNGVPYVNFLSSTTRKVQCKLTLSHDKISALANVIIHIDND